jgi:hypothetical protein
LVKRTLPRVSAKTIEGARPSEMPGFIKPQLATLKSRAPNGSQWLHEIKYDGYRVQIHLNKGKRKAYTRNGLDWTRRFSVIDDVNVGMREPADSRTWSERIRFRTMTVSLSQTLDDSCQIVWKYLERTAELGDAAAARRDRSSGATGSKGAACSCA